MCGISGLYEKIVNKEEKISLIGLGYVGMPIAVSFSKKADVIGFDINADKIQMYKNGIDPTGEIGGRDIKACSVHFTNDPGMLKEAKFHIVAVPTPIHPDRTPDLSPLEGASRLLGKNMVKGSVVVYESTVYPGVTEEICVPLLEKESGLKCGIDFKVGYSPERINPGDGAHRLETIVKVVSGMDGEALEVIAGVYGLVVEAGVYKAESIKVAEAAKVIENSQRDINIAFMNELSIIFNLMGIDTDAVLKAAGTKWNFIPFRPGLVGGHCIGVDPYYLTYKAEQMGYHPQVILSGRRINDSIGRYVAENTVKSLIKAGVYVRGAGVAILGFTFKEDCPDCRNTKVIDIINELEEYGIKALAADPVADKDEAYREYGIPLCELGELKDLDAVILAVPHKEYLKITKKEFDGMYKSNGRQQKVMLDLKGIRDRDELEPEYIYWRL